MNRTSSRGCNWPKTVIQLVSLLVFVFFVSGLAQKMLPSAVSYLRERGPALASFISGIPSLGTFAVILAFLFVVFFARIFCGYICPVGTVEDVLADLRDGFCIKSIKVRPGSTLDGFLRVLKYVILFGLTYLFINGVQVTAGGWILAAIIVTIVLGGILVNRFWCKYICPAGAIVNTTRYWPMVILVTIIYWGLNYWTSFSIGWIWLVAAYCLFGYLSEVLLRDTWLHVFRIVKEDDRCSHCGDCDRSCPYSLDISRCGGRLNDVDCTLCGKCVNACRHKALGVGVIRKTRAGRGFARFLPPIFAILLIIVLAFIGK